MSNQPNILITGNSGFIGMHLFNRLMPKYTLTGIDNLNDYYDVALKLSRLAVSGFNCQGKPGETCTNNSGATFYCADISDKAELERVFQKHRFDFVIHLAAQAGVRYSITHPDIYVKSNVEGFLNVLEACRHNDVKHLIYASSSSVYGLNAKLPFSVNDTTDHPVSLYGATKKANELMAHAYAHLYALPVTGLRFFTVYGPYGRPDMAIFKFTKNIISGQPIEVFNNGDMQRDFTYVNDICESIERLLALSPQANPRFDLNNPIPSQSTAPFRIFNIGNHQPVNLLAFIRAIEKATGKQAKLDYKPLQPGDVLNTFADVDELYRHVNFFPQTNIDDGVRSFVEWYREYYHEG